MSLLQAVLTNDVIGVNVHVLARSHDEPFVNATADVCPLAQALIMGNPTIIKAIIEACVDVNWRYNDGTTAFVRAIESGHAVAVETMIDRDVNMNIKTVSGGWALLAATRVNRFDLVCDMVADTQPNRFKDCALVIAATKGWRDIVELLLDNGAVVESFYVSDDINDKSKTPLMAAAANGHVDIMAMLLAAGADVNTLDLRKQSALVHAAERGDTHMVQFLIDCGASVDGYGDHNSVGVPINAAMAIKDKNSKIAMTKMLAQAGADLELVDDKGNTVLIRRISAATAYNDNCDAVTALVDAGANINATNSQGQSVLSAAIETNLDHIVKLLLNRNVNVNAAAGVYGSALSLALTRRRPRVVSWLLQAGATIELQDIDNASGPLKDALKVLAHTPMHTVGPPTLLDRALQYVQLHRHTLVADTAELRRKLPAELAQDVAGADILYRTPAAWRRFVVDTLPKRP